MNSEIIRMIEENGIKPTPMRMLVLEQLVVQAKSLSLTEIENLLYPSDRITIYRTLQTFVKSGIAHIIDSANSGSVYALCADGCGANSHADHHPHFFCENCKSISCNNDFHFTIKQKDDSPNYIVRKIEVSIKGLCPNCSSTSDLQ